MNDIKISLDAIDKVKKFVNIITHYDGDFDLVSDRYIIDAKSIMGIFSLDLSTPLVLRVHDDSELAGVTAELDAFIVR